MDSHLLPLSLLTTHSSLPSRRSCSSSQRRTHPHSRARSGHQASAISSHSASKWMRGNDRPRRSSYATDGSGTRSARARCRPWWSAMRSTSRRGRRARIRRSIIATATSRRTRRLQVLIPVPRGNPRAFCVGGASCANVLPRFSRQSPLANRFVRRKLATSVRVEQPPPQEPFARWRVLGLSQPNRSPPPTHVPRTKHCLAISNPGPVSASPLRTIAYVG